MHYGLANLMMYITLQTQDNLWLLFHSDHKIDGTAFLRLTMDTLEKLGIEAWTDRLSIYDLVEEMEVGSVISNQ